MNPPQARGRCERFFGTWQGRLPQELRLRQITTMETANAFLRTHWIPFHNQNFTVPGLNNRVRLSCLTQARI